MPPALALTVSEVGEATSKASQELDQCLAWQATAQPNPPESLQSSPLPVCVCDKLKIDFYGPLPSGQYILVIMNCYSRFPEVEILTSISAKSVILRLDSVFARHYLEIVKSLTGITKRDKNDEQQNKRDRTYADARRRTHPSNISVGNTVLVKQKKRNKFSTNFSPTPVYSSSGQRI